jgi:hypothetical protein
MEGAAAQFKEFINPQLNEWVKEALAGNGGYKLTNIQHKQQDGRYLLLTMMQLGLITPSVVEKMTREGSSRGAIKLMDQYRGSKRGKGPRSGPGKRKKGQ